MKITLKMPLCLTTTTILCLIIVTLFATTSCYKPENPNEDVYVYANKAENVVYAKVENASEYNNITEVKLVMWNINISKHIELARGDWNDDGFTIVLPAIDSNNFRTLINQKVLPAIISDISSTISITNIDARVGVVEFWGVDKNGNGIVQFFLHKIDEVGNTGTSFFQYVDSDVAISGYIEKGTTATDFDKYCECTTMWAWQNRTTYSVKMQKGWNIWSNFRSSSKGTITDKWTITTPID